MKRRNDLYITEYMLQASLQNRQKNSPLWKYCAGAIALVILATGIYVLSTR